MKNNNEKVMFTADVNDLDDLMAAIKKKGESMGVDVTKMTIGEAMQITGINFGNLRDIKIISRG